MPRRLRAHCQIAGARQRSPRPSIGFRAASSQSPSSTRTRTGASSRPAVIAIGVCIFVATAASAVYWDGLSWLWGAVAALALILATDLLTVANERS